MTDKPDPYHPSFIEIAALRGLLDAAQRWIDEAAFDREDEEGILLARKIRAAIHTPTRESE